MKSNMLKKVISAIAVMSLVAVSGMSAIAADSPIAQDGDISVKDQDIAVTQPDGTAGYVKVEEATTSDKDKLTQDDVKQAVADAGIVYDEAKTSVVVVDITSNLTPSAQNPVTVRVAIEGVKAGDSVIVMNFYDGAWHAVTVTGVEDGYVTCSFVHFSPVTFIITKDPVKASPATTPVTTTTAATKTSPKTGE